MVTSALVHTARKHGAKRAKTAQIILFILVQSKLKKLVMVQSGAKGYPQKSLATNLKLQKKYPKFQVAAKSQKLDP